MQTKKTKTRTLIFSIAFLSTILFVSCSFFANSSLDDTSAKAGTVTISLGALTGARSITSDFATIIGKFDVLLTDSKGTVRTCSANSAAATASLIDVYPGTFSIEVKAYALDTTTQIGFGSATGSVIEGGSTAVSVPVTLSNLPMIGEGSLELSISYPDNLGINSVVAAFTAGDPSTANVDSNTVTSTANSTVTRKLTASGISAGAHSLAITFKHGTVIVGSVVESLNVWDGAISNLWLKGDGTTSTVRAFTADEIDSSLAKLASITFAGKNVLLASDKYDYETGKSEGDYITADTISFTVTGNAAGQTIKYGWDTSSSTPNPLVSGTMISGQGVVKSAQNNLYITVTSPDGTKSAFYHFYFMPRCLVNFVTPVGGTPVSQVVNYKDMVSAPTGWPSASTSDYSFVGWYSDIPGPIAFAFGSTLVTKNITLTAKWVKLGGITIVVGIPGYTKFNFMKDGKEITSTTIDKNGALILSYGSTVSSSDYKWYIDGNSIGSGSTLTYAPTSASDAFKTGTHVITATMTAGGISYSGSITVTVTDDYMITVIPKGNPTSNTYAQTVWRGSTTYVCTHTFTRPYLLGRYEVSWGLWDAVRLWAENHGYSFIRTGQSGNTGTLDDYQPVTSITDYDAMLWCNAYSEMTGYTPCYYTHASQHISVNIVKNGIDMMSLKKTDVEWSANGYRLPTEAEWHYAASCGGYYPYNYISGAGDVYNSINAHNATYSNLATSGTTRIGNNSPNSWGFYNMSGNVYEFCFDTYTNPPSGAQSDYINDTDSGRVMCGGSYATTSLFEATVGFQGWMTSGANSNTVGFRLARTIQ